MVSLKLRKTLILILKLIKFIIRALTKPASLVRTKKNRLLVTVDFFYNFMWLAPQRHCAVQQKNDKYLQGVSRDYGS